MKQTWLIVGLLSTIALAGCLDGSGDPDDPYFVEGCRVGTQDDDGVNIIHPHDQPYVPPLDDEGHVDFNEYDLWDFSKTNYRTCTLPKVGYNDLREGDPHDYIGEIDFRGDLDLGALAVLGRSGDSPLVYLIDISDRDDPQVVSSIEQQGTDIVDVKISDDGDYLFTASQDRVYSVSTSNPAASGLDTEYLRASETAAPAGFTIYDIRDPSAPTYVQTVVNADENGCHMLSHEIVDDTDVVFCVGGNVHAYGLVRSDDGPWTELGRFSYRLPDGSGTTTASPTGCVHDDSAIDYADRNADSASSGATSAASEQAYGALCEAPHDVTVKKDPVDDRVLMSIAHWNEGVRIVDASAPVEDQFVTLARWTGEGAEHYVGDVHSAQTFWVGDKRYTVASPEIRSGDVVPGLWVLDSTDLGDGSEIKELDLVAQWYHPAEIPTPRLTFTTHQWQVAPTGPDVALEDVNIYITMNHFGVWVLDFEEILAGNTEAAIGGFHMSRKPLDREEESGAAIYSTWDVNVVDGYIYGSDRATGLWVFDYTGDGPDATDLHGFA